MFTTSPHSSLLYPNLPLPNPRACACLLLNHYLTRWKKMKQEIFSNYVEYVTAAIMSNNVHII